MSEGWACPKCGAIAHKHGRGGAAVCRYGTLAPCDGLICECYDLPESEEPDHGIVQTNRCRNANCYHCGWGGILPQRPKKMPPWATKALDAGWTPPKGWKP